jgi:hypothetical protein
LGHIHGFPLLTDVYIKFQLAYSDEVSVSEDPEDKQKHLITLRDVDSRPGEDDG